jgi:hypothetical protein
MALSNPISITTSGTGLSDVLGAGSGLAIAAYLALVTLNGNIAPLLTQLKQEEGYLEFLIAIILIWALNKWGPTNKVTDLLTVGVILGLVFRISSKIDLVGITKNFANGQATMQQTAQAIIQGL